jgi:DNA-binding MarR family transcriptional regulator
VIAAVPSIPAQQVCEITAIDKAAVSRGLKSLSELGFVKFTAARSDSRAKMVELSSKGRKIHDLVIEIALEREEMLLSVLNKEERRHLITALKKLRANLHDVNKWHPPAIS